MAKIHIHIHEGYQGSRGLKTYAERSIAESHKGQGKLGTGEPKAREHDSDKGEAHRKAMHEYASFSDPAGRNTLIKQMGPTQARKVRAERSAPAPRPAMHPHEHDADDATTRVGKTRGQMARKRGETMQNMAGARVANVTAASGSTEFAKNSTLKGHKAVMGRAFHKAKTVR